MLGTTQHAWPLDESELKPARQLIVALAHADMGVLMLHDDSAGQLVPVLAHGMTPHQVERIGCHRPAEGLFAIATGQHKRVRVHDAPTEPSFFHELAQETGFRQAELLPFFRRDGSVLGVFALIHRRARRARRLSVVLEQ
jgi:hypothetical protein